jgi:hypothetical protein
MASVAILALACIHDLNRPVQPRVEQPRSVIESTTQR